MENESGFINRVSTKREKPFILGTLGSNIFSRDPHTRSIFPTMLHFFPLIKYIYPSQDMGSSSCLSRTENQKRKIVKYRWIDRCKRRISHGVSAANIGFTIRMTVIQARSYWQILSLYPNNAVLKSVAKTGNGSLRSNIEVSSMQPLIPNHRSTKPRSNDHPRATMFRCVSSVNRSATKPETARGFVTFRTEDAPFLWFRELLLTSQARLGLVS